MNSHQTTKIAKHLSSKYKPINTEIVLAELSKKGWTPSNFMGDKTLLGKHSYTLVNPEFRYSNGDALNITIVNSCDGSTRFSFMGGYMRLVCSNGLVIGDFAGIRVKHLGSIYEQLDNAYDKVVAHLNKIREDVERLKNTEMDGNKIKEVTLNVARSFFNKETKTEKYEVIDIPNNVLSRLYRVRRNEDLGNSAFLKLNVLQENIIRKGMLRATIKITNKETGKETLKSMGKRPSENNLSSLQLNLKLSKEFLKVC